MKRLLLAGVLVAPFLISCTRAAKESKSTISFSIPQSASSKVGVQAYDTLLHVSINISGSGIPAPIIFNWDNEKSGGSGTPPPAPTSFSVDIPQGPDRLIQVLAVYGDSTNSGGGAMQFYYGDVTKTLAAAVEDAPVTVTSVGQGTAIVAGRIQGRYLTSANDGPTGRVDVVYAPPGGKTPMVVERTMIMSGWFQFFGLLGAQLSYRLQDGTSLWGGPVDLSETSFPVSSRVLRATVPIHTRMENRNGTVTTYPQDPEISIYGFFGDPALLSTKYVCKSSSALTNLLKLGTATALTVTDSNSADPANLFDTTLSYVNLRGGVALGGAAPCDTQVNISSNLFSSALAFKASMLENGGDSSAGFRLPFQLAAANNGGVFASTIVNASQVSVTGTLLPGIANLLDNFSVYKAVNLGTNFHYHSSFAPCENLPAMGFILVGDTPVPGLTYTATLPLTDAEAGGGVMFALCPSKAGLAVGPGVWVEGSYLRGGGGGGGGVPAKIGFENISAITVSQCRHMNLTLLTSSDTSASSANVETVNLTQTGNGSAFYAENDFTCSGTAITSIAIPSGSSWVGLNFMTAATTNTDIILTPTDAAGVLTSVAKTVRVRAAGATTDLQLATSSQSVNVGTCLPVSVKTIETNGNVVSFTGSGAATAMGASLYSDMSCSTPTSGLNFAAGVSTIYIKSTATGWANMQVSATVDSLNFTSNFGIAVVPAGQPTQLTLSSPAPNYLYINQCMPITVTAKDDAGTASNLSAAQVIKFFPNGGGAGNNFFTDSNCTASMTNMETGIGSGQSAITVYFKPQSSGPLNLNASISTQSSSMSGNQNYTIGDLWMHVTANGFNAAWYDSTCGSLVFELRNHSLAGSGAVIPNFSGSPISITMATNSATVDGGLYSTNNCSDSVVATKTASIAHSASGMTIYMKSLLTSGNYLSVSPTYSGNYSSIYQNGNTLTSMSFSWCPPLDGGGACASSLTLTGAGVGGGLASYGSIGTATSVDKTITITAASSASLSLSISGANASDYSFKGGTYPGTGGTCATSLSTSASCTVVVTFTPSAIGARYGSLDISYNASTLSLALQGAGL